MLGASSVIAGALAMKSAPPLGALLLSHTAGAEAVKSFNELYLAIVWTVLLSFSGFQPVLLQNSKSRLVAGTSESTADSLSAAVLVVVFLLSVAVGLADALVFRTTDQIFERVSTSAIYALFTAGTTIANARGHNAEVMAAQFVFLIVFICGLSATVSVAPTGPGAATWLAVACIAGMSVIVSRHRQNIRASVQNLLPNLITLSGTRYLSSVFPYFLFSISSTGLTFLFLRWIATKYATGDFNNTMLAYQVFGLLTFVPSSLVAFTVPELTTASSSENWGRNFRLPLMYLVAVLPFSLLAACLFRFVLILFGYAEPRTLVEPALIILTAIPASILAGLMQLSVAERLPWLPLRASAIANSVAIVIIATFGVTSPIMGIVLMTYYCVAVAISVLHLYSKQFS